MKAFGVTHNGYTGGSTYHPLYLNREDAISRLLEVVSKENSECFLKLTDTGDNYFSNSIDDYYIQEFEII